MIMASKSQPAASSFAGSSCVAATFSVASFLSPPAFAAASASRSAVEMGAGDESTADAGNLDGGRGTGLLSKGVAAAPPPLSVPPMAIWLLLEGYLPDAVHCSGLNCPGRVPIGAGGCCPSRGGSTVCRLARASMSSRSMIGIGALSASGAAVRYSEQRSVVVLILTSGCEVKVV